MYKYFFLKKFLGFKLFDRLEIYGTIQKKKPNEHNLINFL